MFKVHDEKNMKKNEIEKHFSETSLVWKNNIYKPRYSQKIFEYFDKQYRFDYVCEMIPNVKNPKKKYRALDMGCGAGQLMPVLVKLGYVSYGVDISEEMIELTKETCKLNNITAEVQKGDCENLCFDENFFDLYVAMGVIEYMKSDKPMLSEIFRILKPGGCAIVTLRNIKCVPVRINYFYKSKIQSNIRNSVKKIFGLHTSKFREISKEHDPKEFKEMLNRCGFKIIDECYCHYHTLPLPFSRWLFPIHSLGGKKMEDAFKEVPKPSLASTYIVKFEKPL